MRCSIQVGDEIGVPHRLVMRLMRCVTQVGDEIVRCVVQVMK